MFTQIQQLTSDSNFKIEKLNKYLTERLLCFNQKFRSLLGKSYQRP